MEKKETKRKGKKKEKTRAKKKTRNEKELRRKIQGERKKEGKNIDKQLQNMLKKTSTRIINKDRKGEKKKKA